MPAPIPRGVRGDDAESCSFLLQLCISVTRFIRVVPHSPTEGLLSGFLLGSDSRGAHATCLTRSGRFVERLARIVSIIDRKIFAPSALPSRASHARSGCGIKPKTFRSRLQTPAMFSIEPFGFASDRKSTRLNSSHVEISYAV